MLPKIHFLIGLIFTIIFHFIFPQISFFYLSLIFFSSFLIDVDHVIYYAVKEKNLNPYKASSWFKNHLNQTMSLPMNERKKIYTGFYFFHGIEWLVILFFLGIYVNQIFSFIFIGFFLHMVVDIPSEILLKRTFDKSSLIWNIYRFKKLKKLN